MTVVALLAFAAGALVVVSRQINGRLSLHGSALEASFWNHAVGAAVLSLSALAFGGLFAGQPWAAPWWAYLGGPVGVAFIALSSWLVARIGAAQTALYVIAGQMVSGVALDLWMGAPGDGWARILGVGLILAGALVSGRPRRAGVR